MSRRKIMLLAVALMTSLGLGCYLPEYFSPFPALVAELRSCLEPTGDDADVDVNEVNVDPHQGIQVELLFAGINTTLAGTTILADADNEGRSVAGRVNDRQRLQIAMRRLEELGCVSILSKPVISTSGGFRGRMSYGQDAPVVSAIDGVSIEIKSFGITIDSLASRRGDGRIDLQLDLTVSEVGRFVAGPGGVSVARFEPLSAKITANLSDGETCFVGGLKRKHPETRSHRLPLLSDLPGIGSWFEFRHEVEFDEELLILATPTLGPLQFPMKLP